MNRGSRNYDLPSSGLGSSDRQMTLFPAEGASVGSAESTSPANALPANELPANAFPAKPLKSAGQGRRTVAARTIMVNPHLLAARRIARRMRRLKDREAETQAGLAICAQLKAYLQDDLSSSPDSRH